MTATELYRAGKLQAAIDAQIQEVKAHAADPNRRLFLFELAAFAGDLDRARRQIDAVQYNDADRDAAVLTYKKLLDAEEKRRRLFRDGVPPRFLADPPAHVQLRLDAAKLLRENKPAEALGLLSQANAGAEAIKGTLNGKPFAGFRDADDLFGTTLEVFAHGEYFWVPVEQVDSMALNAPRFPRDLLWMPARLVLKAGEQGEVFLPVLYPNSHEHPDEAVRLGRTNDWKQADGGPVLGVGARVFLAGEDGVGVAEWRELRVDE
jgi:type VI secretion system protein ImpE